MTLPIQPPYPPMEMETAAKLPEEPRWQYEPKWDGFRCLAFRDGDEVELQSKSGQPLGRYFPEMLEDLRALGAKKFVIDGELVIPVGGSLSFDDLLMRIHPAESRVRKLAKETPSVLMVFDLLVDTRGTLLTRKCLDERRKALEKFAERYFMDNKSIRLSPATPDIEKAREWMSSVGGLDGIVAKKLDVEYRSGERDGAVKVKNIRTADCVVGGFRYLEKKHEVGSLLLGLYDDAGLLHHVGFTSGIANSERPAITKKLEPLVKPPGFTGRAPGGPSRWSTARSGEWQPLVPKLVVEVQYDHFSGGRFRHGTKLLRWRPDKAPKQCLMRQVERESPKI